jgi:drug/metabolite transporter (DMT)-like permease
VQRSSQSTRTSLLQVHAAVLLFGLSGLFGKYIALPAPLITLGRVVFAAIALLIVLAALRARFVLAARRDYLLLPLTGAVLAAHWAAFFQSVQVSTVAIALISFATFPVFVTFLEPLVFPQALRTLDVALALLTLGGVALVVPSVQLADATTQGVLWGLLAASSFAVLSLFNRYFVRRYSSLLISFYQDATAVLVLLPFLLFYQQPLTMRDLFLLVVLGVVFTALAHTLFIQGLRGVKTQTAGIISSLEPVYGIVFAALLLAEIPTPRTLLGGMLILSVVLYSSWRSGRERTAS